MKVFGINLSFVEFKDIVFGPEEPTSENVELYIFPLDSKTTVQFPAVVALTFNFKELSFENIDIFLLPLKVIQLLFEKRDPFIFPENVAVIGEPTATGT